MKRIINLLAEVLALPYSEYFSQKDCFVECAEKSKINNRKNDEGRRVVDLDNEIADTAMTIAGYLNQYLNIPNLTVLQGLIHYAFRGRDIIEYMDHNEGLKHPRAIMNQYYIDRLAKITDILITTRNGRAVLRPWDSLPKEDIFQTLDTSRIVTINDGLSFSPMRIELWNSLLRCFPEDLLLSCFAAICAKKAENVLQARKMTFNMLLSFGNHICVSDALLDGVLEKGMAETHLHAGASRDFGLIWETMLTDAVSFNSVLESKDTSYSLSYKQYEVEEKRLYNIALDAAFIRTILAFFLQSGEKNIVEFLHKDRFSTRYFSFFQIFVRDIIQKGTSSLHFDSVYQKGEPFWPYETLKDEFSLWEILHMPVQLEKSCPSLAEKCFLSWSIIYIQKASDDYIFTALFLYYLRKKQETYRMRVQDEKNKGLQYFQQFYSLSTDRGSIEWDQNISNQIFTALEDPRVIKTEFRFTPPTSKEQKMENAIFDIEKALKTYLGYFIREHLYAVVLKYSENYLNGNKNDVGLKRQFNQEWHIAIDNILAGRKGELILLLQKLGIAIEDIVPHRIGIIYHLIKKGEKAEKEACFAREQLTERQKYEQYTFGSARFDYEASIRAISNLRNSSPEISRLIVGVDAAALEIPTEPFVFSSAFRNAKHQNACWGRHEKANNRKSLLGITYHVGEDFRHPFSGLRHIDEAFCGLSMHPGDRIGHGIALGMNMDRWFRLNGMAVMPRIERMENNLWIWHLMTTESCLSGIAKYSNMIEKQILEDARIIYRDLHGITVDNLYYAYSRKMLSIKELQSIVEKNRNHFITDCKTCFSELGKAKFFPCWKTDDGFWREDMLLLSYHCGLFKQRMNESIISFTNSAQREIAETIQQYMLEKIATNGIIVETNPSSNTTIGEMDGILTHPICHLRSDKEHRVMTTINTDDPSVFNATVANEHAQVYYALLYNGLSTEEALREIDIMRETALRTSFITSPISVGEMLKDYEVILKQIM